MSVALTRGLARRPQVPLADLAGQPWAVSHRHPAMLRHIRKVFTAEGIAPPQALVRTDSLALMLALRGSPFRRQRTGYLLQRRRTRLQPAAAALVEHVRAVCLELYGASPGPGG